MSLCHFCVGSEVNIQVLGERGSGGNEKNASLTERPGATLSGSAQIPAPWSPQPAPYTTPLLKLGARKIGA